MQNENVWLFGQSLLGILRWQLKAWNQAWDTSEHSVLCHCTANIPMKLSLMREKVSTGEGHTGSFRRLKHFSYKQELRDTKKGFWLLYLKRPVPTQFQSLLFFNTPQSWGEQMLNKEENNSFDGEVNHKLCRGTWFQICLCVGFHE